MAQTTSQPITLRHPIADALAARGPWQPAPLTRLLTNVSGAVRSVSAAIDGIERTWHDLAVESLEDTGAIPYRPEVTQPATPPADRPPIWVVLGDSTAQGIGASTLDHGWVSRIETALAAAGRRHAVINLSRSGADSTHVIDEQLPLLAFLPYAPSLVTICAGANDLMRNPYPPRLARRLERMAAAAPRGTVIASLPAPRFSPAGIHVNRALRRAAAAHGHLVAELGPHLVSPLKGLSIDRFHPNDTGYGAWVRAFAATLGIDAELVPAHGTFTSVVRAPAMRGTTASD
ncbi:MAG: SGNH/GDSL hydrolase family protein [Acidimicrobiales bacterium]